MTPSLCPTTPTWTTSLPRWRLPLTFLFGLVHGFGFAGALSEANLERSSALVSLLSFNLGVEAGQVLLVACLYPGLRWLEENASDVRMIMQVHDELVFEGPHARIVELAPLIAGRMVRIHALSVPLVADYGVGDDWDAAHDATGHAQS